MKVGALIFANEILNGEVVYPNSYIIGAELAKIGVSPIQIETI